MILKTKLLGMIMKEKRGNLLKKIIIKELIILPIFAILFFKILLLIIKSAHNKGQNYKLISKEKCKLLKVVLFNTIFKNNKIKLFIITYFFNLNFGILIQTVID